MSGHGQHCLCPRHGGAEPTPVTEKELAALISGEVGGYFDDRYNPAVECLDAAKAILERYELRRKR